MYIYNMFINTVFFKNLLNYNLRNGYTGVTVLAIK